MSAFARPRASALVVGACVAVFAARAPADPLSEEENAALAREATVAAVLAAALAHHPAIFEAKARVQASAERTGASGRRPDPEVRYEQWAVPLDRPYALGDANMLMVGVKQAFPAPGSLGAQRRAAESEAQASKDDLRTRELDLAFEVKRAFAEYARAEAELGIRREIVAITTKLTDVARAQYASGRLSQEDALRTATEVSRLEAALVDVEQERRSAKARLNVLMGRAPDAPLGPPRLAEPRKIQLPANVALDANRPEIARAQAAAERSAAIVDASRAERRWPMFMVGLDYVYDPMRATDPMRPAPGSAYSAMLGMTLPWLNPGRDAQERAAQADLVADERSVDAVRLNAQFELADATARVEAAQKTLALLDERVLPDVRRAFEAARASFGTGSGSALGVLDSLRTLLQTEIDRTRAIARVSESVAALERAAGTSVSSSGK